MNADFASENPGFKVKYHSNFSGGRFSGGFLLFGASSRELAERNQDEFTLTINHALEQLDAGFRLGE